ncbi:molybdate ABC transporter substrate-binding protein [Sphingomonas sp. BK235]|uniref:molybdate ABC transporter substrate-binding protein n=1 Tax=Sphingomonas sp. BK235 TaxID=2512131 RepID=UPI001048512E|nr:molybdate ABC transporter substrate-binding protein [Sphingomonas sp. BK235]TCP30407.1 molybdenum ABC transporter molybdate-binding protein [Sphingomonas sp. BK235]
MIRFPVSFVAAVLTTGSAPAEPIRPPLVVYAAGSTTGVLQAMIDRYSERTGQRVTLHTGPAGLMRERIEAGDKVDLFVSANMDHPRRLQAEGLAGPVALFARNSLCVSALPTVGLTQANLLDRLLDPRVRIGTSTPGADPGGDYAHKFFERADAIRPGSTATLKAKAQAVVGSRIEEPAAAPTGSAADAMIRRNIDTSVGYCSSRVTTPDTSVAKVRVPAALAVPIRYGMTVVSTSKDGRRMGAAKRLASYLRGAEAQALMASFGFSRVQ